MAPLLRSAAIKKTEECGRRIFTLLRIGVGPQSARTPRSVARRAENQSGRSASAFRDEASLTDRVAGYSHRGPRHAAVCLDGRPPPPRRTAFDHASVAPRRSDSVITVQRRLTRHRSVSTPRACCGRPME